MGTWGIRRLVLGAVATSAFVVVGIAACSNEVSDATADPVSPAPTATTHHVGQKKPIPKRHVPSTGLPAKRPGAGFKIGPGHHKGESPGVEGPMAMATGPGAMAAPMCPDPLDLCGNTCVDIRSDAANCGGCGNACGSGQRCMLSVCSPCLSTDTVCSGTCADLSSDASNCGSCGAACQPNQKCDGGKCADFCTGGQVNCYGLCVDDQTNPLNCGGCGNVCFSGLECEAGSCVCKSPNAWCDGKCMSVQSDPNNCGACNNKCAPNQICMDGACK